ncbi:MAG: PEP-CTERM sorting domain-containing protein [Chthonomonas sp.]|nr:PEP-CTERM sorting domain-containing protein [Chthonomonas sp.]
MSILISVGGAAQASFEMMMFVEGNRIVRYDPENRVQLGSFGAGELGTYSGAQIAADPTNHGVVAALNGDGTIRRFNAFTGRYLGALSVGVNPFYGNGPMRFEVLNNGNFLIAGYVGGGLEQVSRIYSGTTGAQLADMSPFGGAYWALDSVQGSDGNIYTLNRITNAGTSTFYTFCYTSSGTYLGATGLGTSSDASRFRAIGRSGNRILITGNVQYAAVTHANGPFQAATPVGWSSWSSAGMTGDIVWSHSRNYLHEVYNNSGSYVNRVNYYDPGINYMGQGAIDLPYTTSLGSMTIITAPEPGTMAALAAGVGLLIRKRKKK